MSEGFLSELLCIGNVCMETSDLHGLILCVSEGDLFLLLCIHILNTVDFCEPYSRLLDGCAEYLYLN